MQHKINFNRMLHTQIDPSHHLKKISNQNFSEDEKEVEYSLLMQKIKFILKIIEHVMIIKSV